MFNQELREDLEKVKEQIDFNHYVHADFSNGRWRIGFLTLKDVIKSIESRLDHQENMQKMLFAHLGIEYAKITEETKDGKREKEVLRKIKKQSR
jgi:hypothetical protein